MRRLLLVLALGLGCCLIAPSRSAAQATPYLPDLDPAYGDLDALAAGGWVRSAMDGKRPYSRLEVARLTAEAKDRLGSDEGEPKARFREALARLEQEFAPELASLCADGVATCAPLKSRFTLRNAAVDATLADSPSRPIPTSYDSLGADYIDADLNPLLQMNQGRVLADGATLGVEALGDFTLGTRIAGQARPRVWATSASGDVGADVTLLEGYARALFGPVAMELGRNHIAQGHGPQAGPMVARNARGLDMFRLTFERPRRLPWVLGALGTVDGSLLIADLGGDRLQPHSKLVIGEGRWKPASWIEIGGSLLNNQGGEGAPDSSWRERLSDLLGTYILIYPHHQISDKVLQADLLLSVPAARAQLWLQGMVTDDHNMFRTASEALGTEAAWILGAKVTGLGPEGRIDLWGEGRRTGVRPHTHHQFRSGLTEDRRLIGDATGPLARGVIVGVDWRGRSHTATLSAASERYNNADRYQDLPGGRAAWVRVTDNPDETRIRVIADWATDRVPRRFVPGLRLGYEHVDTFGFTTGSRRSNLFAQGRLEYHW